MSKSNCCTKVKPIKGEKIIKFKKGTRRLDLEFCRFWQIASDFGWCGEKRKSQCHLQAWMPELKLDQWMN
jgi:hypothetical protein